MIVDWQGCYDRGWRGLIVDAAFAHPAKMSRGLLARIFDELFASGALKAGDLVVDPFGGIGTTGIEAASRGVRFVGCELEPKFVDLARLSFAKHAADWRDMGRPQPVIVQGDSRHLRDVLRLAGVDVCVSSPPYDAGLGHGGKGQALIDEKALHYGDYDYGTAAGQLGAMPSGAVDVVLSSPPFTQGYSGGGGINVEGYVGDKRKPGWSGTKEGPDPVGSRTYQGTGGERADGNLETMPFGDVSAVISSPPYAEIASGSGGLNTKPAGPGQQGGRSPSSASQDTDARYGTADGQLARMALGEVAAVVSSPPYEGSLHASDDGIDWEKARRETTNGGSHQAPGASAGAAYERNDASIGNSTGDTFWTAARDIVAESFAILKPGGVAVWVVKSFVRNKAIVDFPGDWRRLCEHVGFVTTLEVHASLVSETTHNDLFDGTTTKRTERKSFFRRLAEKKGSPRIDYEVVLFMTEPATQPATGRCPDCHGATIVTPWQSLWEFTSRCVGAGTWKGCGERIISWAHASPPPTYVAPPIAPLLPLFEEVPE